MIQHTPHTRESDTLWPQEARDELCAWEDKWNAKCPEHYFGVVSSQHYAMRIEELGRRISTPLTPSDEMVEAGALAIEQSEATFDWEGKLGREAARQFIFQHYARACLTAALNLMGGKK